MSIGVVNTNLPWFSMADSANYFFAQSAGNIRSQAGSFSVGNKFSVSKALTCTGVKCFWKSPGSNKTLKLTLWRAAVSVATVNVNVTASGLYTANFALPVALDVYQDYAVTMWENGGGTFTDMLADGASAPFFAEPIVGMIPVNAFTVVRSFKRYAAGDAVPANTSSGAVFPVDPVIAPYNLIDGAII